MKTNSTLKAILELLGDHENGAYYLPLNDKKIPVLLNKDETTVYPEIRLSPFVEKYSLEHQKYIERNYARYRDWEAGVCQIDLFAQTVVEVQNIYDEIMNRLYDFFNLETVIYNYNDDFTQLDDNYYKNEAYAVNHDLFIDIYDIEVKGKKLTRVSSIDDISEESFYVDDEALYINTECIECIKIKVLMQGRLFSNGDAFSDRGLHYIEFSQQRNLSSLEDNDVERISFDMYVVYSHKREREELPVVNKVSYNKKSYIK